MPTIPRISETEWEIMRVVWARSPLTAAELRFVFLHEFAHLKRRDVVLNRLTTALQVLHWFNPLVWLAFARMRADRELACDALALACAGESERQACGATILRLLEQFTRPVAVPGLVGILEDKHQLRRRIVAIAGFRRPSRWSALVFAFQLAGLASGGNWLGIRPVFLLVSPGPQGVDANTQITGNVAVRFPAGLGQFHRLLAKGGVIGLVCSWHRSSLSFLPLRARVRKIQETSYPRQRTVERVRGGGGAHVHSRAEAEDPVLDGQAAGAGGGVPGQSPAGAGSARATAEPATQ